MKVVGLITEYNPFHFGHLYHLERSKLETNADYSIAIMSGSFLQRGEPSLVDKWTKAKMAIDNGVDLVIELPFIFSTQTAELFAYGSILLLDKLNIVDYIAFGSELGSLDYLNEIVDILVEEPPYYKQRLRKYLDLGNSFPVSCSNALKDYFSTFSSKIEDPNNIKNILEMSNNILAIEYLKALKIINSNIKPITIKRIGNPYNENALNNKVASATGIRNSLLNNGINSIEKYVPHETYYHLINYNHKYKNFNTLNNYSQIINYLLRTQDINKLKDIMNIEIGLENRIVQKSTQCQNMDTLIQSISTKRYTKTRIQRILIHLMNGLTKSIFHKLLPHYPSYIRVLGANGNGLFLLKKIKEKSNLPIITKFADYNKYNNPHINEVISFDKKATDLYFLGINADKPYMNMDYYTTPYISQIYK